MLIKVDIQRLSDQCPFKNENISFELNKGECLWLKGESGSGKTSIANDLTKVGALRGAKVDVHWKEPLQEGEQPIGTLFQDGVLIDSLNLKENLVLSLRSVNKEHDNTVISNILKSLDLKESDILKMPNELSGGMLRRAALSLILAQEKKLIILDEPFVGLDTKNVEGVISIISELMKKGISFILISHQEYFCDKIVTPGKEIALQTTVHPPAVEKEHTYPRWCVSVRIMVKIIDYLGISLPLIICSFFAAGFAMSILFAQMLKETDIQTIMDQFHSEHTSFFFKLFGKEIVRVADKYMPAIKEKIYFITMARGFVVELAPLLTALLLAGRIGGSYAGEVGVMQATGQNKLLVTLGKKPRSWSLIPASIGAFIAAPILTAVGSLIALLAGGWVSVWQKYDLVPSMKDYWAGVTERVFSYTGLWDYIPFVNFYRSMGFMVIILGIAEFSGRFRKNIQPRDVPRCITWAVVYASLGIILCDWFFSQMYHM